MRAFTDALQNNTTRYTAYLAPIGFDLQLKRELKNICAIYERLFVCSGPPQTSFWAQNIWYDAQYIPILSITDAAKKLKDLCRLWHCYSFTLHRRSSLINELLPQFKKSLLTFPSKHKNTTPRIFGLWTLVNKNLLLVSTHTSDPLPLGEYHFEENKVAPPSRAYLKLWEVFTRYNVQPKDHETALEIGAAPGGWSWVLSQLGCHVHAFDRAPLDEKLQNHPLIHYVKGNAFSFTPDKAKQNYDWFLSDMICYPEKLWPFVEQWLLSGRVKKFVVTIKFQGQDHYDIAATFAQVPGSALIHLFHNKHELTWIKLNE